MEQSGQGNGATEWETHNNASMRYFVIQVVDPKSMLNNPTNNIQKIKDLIQNLMINYKLQSIQEIEIRY